jgi:hypothetical protein
MPTSRQGPLSHPCSLEIISVCHMWHKTSSNSGVSMFRPGDLQVRPSDMLFALRARLYCSRNPCHLPTANPEGRVQRLSASRQGKRVPVKVFALSARGDKPRADAIETPPAPAHANGDTYTTRNGSPASNGSSPAPTRLALFSDASSVLTNMQDTQRPRPTQPMVGRQAG